MKKKGKPVGVFSTMSASDPPCRGCADRCPTCHADCENYKAWKADHDSKRDHERLENSYRIYQNDKLLEKECSLRKGTREYKDHYRRV